MNRRQQLLLGVLVVQLVLGVVVFWPQSAPAAGSGPMLGDVKSADITTITIKDGTGNSVKLDRQGDKWVLTAADAFPADAVKVNAALDKLVALKGNRLVTRTAASQKQLKVADADFERRVDFQAGGKDYAVFLGTSPSAGALHFRINGQVETYLTSDLNSSDLGAEATAWIDTNYVNLSATDITVMTLKNASGEMAFTKDDKGAWTMTGLAAGETLNPNSIPGLVQTAGAVRMSAPLGKSDKPEYGMAQPQAVATLKTKDKSVTVTVGARTADDKGGATYVVKSSDSEYYVRVAEFSVQDLVTKKRLDMLQLPATPTAVAKN